MEPILKTTRADSERERFPAPGLLDDVMMLDDVVYITSGIACSL